MAAGGAIVVAPEGKEVTLAVRGVEMGGVLKETRGTETLLSTPGTYFGALLSIADENVIDYAPMAPKPGGGICRYSGR